MGEIENDTPDQSTAKQILIADGELAVRRLLQHLLRKWGYRTLVAHNGQEALEVAENHRGDIDLLLSDLSMPEMGGQELAQKLTKKQPAIKVILMSGFSRVHVILQRGWEFIQKPFTLDDVRKTIKEIL
jgi:two-component system cell cycle sensor histidine kinase/response regulator CckA